MVEVRRTIEIKAPPSSVWRWLASQTGLRAWIAPNLEIDLRVGGAYRFLGPDNKTWVSGRVLEFTPERKLSLSWTEEGNGWAAPARMIIELFSHAAGTRVTLIHDGFEHIGKQNWTETLQDYERGADAHQILQHLAGLIDADR